MANSRTIRRRIKSVKNTSQITKAMQMVASSKMKKAQAAALAGRPFAELLGRMLAHVRDYTDESVHPLLQVRKGERHLLILVTTDKGLCGPLNTNLLREVSARHTPETKYVTVGRKGRQFLQRLGREVVADFEIPDLVTFPQSRQIANFCIEQFKENNFDRVSVAYSQYINTLRQEPVVQPLLPISPIQLPGHSLFDAASESTQPLPEILFEPSPALVLDWLLPRFLQFALHKVILEARASEHSARMVAMKSATDNAKDLIKALTLEYNKLRQASITAELLEISTAQLALS